MPIKDLEFKIIQNAGEGLRLDQYLAQKIPDLSRAYLQKKIIQGEIRVNQKLSRKGYLLRGGDTIEVGTLLQKKERRPAANPDLPIEIIFMDENLAVVEKPPGLPTHPVREDETETLANWWIAQEPKVLQFAEDPLRAGIVHRLDTDTSGLLVLARSAEILHDLQEQFRERQVHKEYLAIVHGHPPKEGHVDFPLAHDPRNKRKMMVVKEINQASPTKIRQARTEFRLEEQFAEHALLRVRTLTGRMHQVRVHLSAIGYPLLGDSIYRKSGPIDSKVFARRHCLHATFLSFTHPKSKTVMEFESPLPRDMSAILEELKNI